MQNKLLCIIIITSRCAPFWLLTPPSEISYCIPTASQVFFLFYSKYTHIPPNNLNFVLICSFVDSEVNYTNLYTCHMFYTQCFEKVPELTVKVSESALSEVGFDVFFRKKPTSIRIWCKGLEYMPSSLKCVICIYINFRKVCSLNYFSVGKGKFKSILLN